MIDWKLLTAVPILDDGAHLSDAEAQRVHGWLCLCTDGAVSSDLQLGGALAGCTHLLNSHRTLTYAEICWIIEVIRGRVPQVDTCPAAAKIEALRAAVDALNERRVP